MTPGERINRRADLGSRIVTLREQIRSLEKLARKTPPRTLLAEVARVAEAKRRLAAARDELASAEIDYSALRAYELTGAS